jgi:3-oxoacyl-(acyl-carrier-protein) synthase
METEMGVAMKPVFVVSDNIISSLGFSTAETIASIHASYTGIIRQSDTEMYPEPLPMARIDSVRLHQLLAEYGLEAYNRTEATAILSILLTNETANIDLSGEENLFLLSTTKGNIAHLSGTIPPEADTYLGYTAGRIAAYFKMKNRPVVVSNACVSGVSALTLAYRLLATGPYENIVVAGIDFVTAFTLSGFQSFKSISSEPCKPYDKARDGLSIGEGVGCILLTNNKAKIAGKKEIRILGGATTNDANHISGPSRTGDGLSLAIENALSYSGVSHRDIDFVNLHGTATVYNDEMESKALQLSALSEVPANSLKGYFGHTLGASGVIETIVCIESLRNQMLYATLGFEVLGTPEPMNVIARHRKANLQTFLKTASGFGGFNSAIVVSCRQFAQSCHSSLDVESSISKSNPRMTVIVRKNQIRRDEEIVYETALDLPFPDFIKSAYKNLGIDYPKFYKMDDLCKLAFVASEYLLKDIPGFGKQSKTKTALVFCTSVSSLDTDIRHQRTILDKNNYFPSPAVFVYTLPNILLGEIAIRNKIQGETMCFVNEKPGEKRLNEYIQLLLETTDTESVIFGEINFLAGEYGAELGILSSF